MNMRDEEIQRRVDEVQSGQVVGVPADLVFARLRAKYHGSAISRGGASGEATMPPASKLISGITLLRSVQTSICLHDLGVRSSPIPPQSSNPSICSTLPQFP